MDRLRRVPVYVWGVVATTLVVTLLLFFAPEDEPNETGAPNAPTVSAQSDPQQLQNEKRVIKRTIEKFVQARFSRQADMKTEDYLKRLEPLASEQYLTEFETILSTSVEQRLIETDTVVRAKLIGADPDGHMDEHNGVMEIDGLMKVKVTVIPVEGVARPLPPLEYEYFMEQTDGEQWVVTYCSPTFS